MAARDWISTDESAKDMLSRVSAERSSMLIPPLHRVPLRPGNVVEIVGPSPSAKTQILIQAAVNCILPKDWCGVHYGGLEHLVMFIDLDCRFDIVRLSQLLKHRLMDSSGGTSSDCLYHSFRQGSQSMIESLELQSLKIPRFGNKVNWEQHNDTWSFDTEKPNIGYDEELFATCMRRFLYIRCYDSFEFLATLKTLHYQLQRAREIHGVTAHFLMIDSIGAFYWADRASTSLHLENSRKRLSLQSVSESVVDEIRKLLLVHPMLVLATKVTILGDTYSTNELKRTSSQLYSNDHSNLTSVTGGPRKLSYREFMPSVWQRFVTHRILVGAAGEEIGNNRKYESGPIFLSEWSMPCLNLSDKFTVRDAGVFIVP